MVHLNPELNSSSCLSHRLYYDFPALDPINLAPSEEGTVLLTCYARQVAGDRVTFCHNGPAEYNPELGIATYFVEAQVPDCRSCLNSHENLQKVGLSIPSQDRASGFKARHG